MDLPVRSPLSICTVFKAAAGNKPVARGSVACQGIAYEAKSHVHGSRVQLIGCGVQPSEYLHRSQGSCGQQASGAGQRCLSGMSA